MGEMIGEIPDKKATSGGGRCSLPNGITWKESHLAQTINDNPEIVEQVKGRARENKTIVTAAEIFKEVKKIEHEKIKDKNREELKSSASESENYIVEKGIEHKEAKDD